MAVTVTPRNPQGVFTKTWDITATADGDTTTGNIAHGFPGVPVVVHTQALIAAGVTAGWQVTSVDATNIVLTKGTAVGSGNANPQVRLIAQLPHSLVA